MLDPRIRAGVWTVLGVLTTLYATSGVSGQAQQVPSRPNMVVFLTDDQGYGDLASFGHPTDQDAEHRPDGARRDPPHVLLRGPLLCPLSRAQFLTGRYSVRSGELTPTGPGSPVGLPQKEITIAEALKAQGYRTGMVGKWHLGDFATRPKFNPTSHGFDFFFGLPDPHDYRLPFVQNAPPVPSYTAAFKELSGRSMRSP